MPARGDIQNEIERLRGGAPDTVRRKHLKRLHKYTKRDGIVYITSFTSKKYPQMPGGLVSISLDDIQGFMASLHRLNGDNLDLILHSPGGSSEAAEQIVAYLRAKYRHIRVIIPQNGMSAASMIACAADEIIMGKHSAIGPIDPQVTFPTPTGLFTAPAQSLLDEFEQAKQEVTADPRTAPLWATKVQTVPHGVLKICQDTIARSKATVKQWLEQYMFASDAKKVEKATEISEWLGSAGEHKSHGRPITIDMARDHGLKVTALEDDDDLQEVVLSVFHSTMATMELTTCIKVIENHNGRGWYINYHQKS